MILLHYDFPGKGMAMTVPADPAFFGGASVAVPHLALTSGGPEATGGAGGQPTGRAPTFSSAEFVRSLEIREWFA